MSFPGKLLSIEGHRVFVHRANRAKPGHAGPPVLFVHGYGVSHWQFRHVLPALAARGLDVIALDLPGHGESDRPSPTDFRYDAQAFLETIVGTLDALGVERASLVGHSMGGGLSMFVAARRPERVARVVACNALCYPYTVPIVGKLSFLPGIGEWLFKRAYSRPMLQQHLRMLIYADTERMVTEEWVDYLWERVSRPGGLDAAYAALTFCRTPESIERAVRAVRAPTLVVWGEGDKLFPVANAQRLAGDLGGGAEVKIVRDCGHSPPEERPVEFVEAIAPFLLAAENERDWRAAG